MEMEDHHHRPHRHQYTIPDFRHLIPGTPPPPSSPPPPPPPPPPHDFSSISSQPYLPLPACQHLEIMLMAEHQHQQVNEHHMIPPYRTRLHELCDNNSTASPSVNTTSSTIGANGITPAMSFGALEVDTGGAGFGGGDGGTGRWPRQETLTLLEIRSRLDSRFKEANQKGPLWDEVSRIMSEEHGYHRSGKKCREKFENLYKYYKKTKDGKAGRQDGKHYRFFRQLEALYGENPNNNTASIPETPRFAPDQGQSLRFQPPVSTNQDTSHQSHKFCESLSLSSSSNNFTTSSSDDDNEHRSLGLLDQSGVCAEKRKGKRQGGGRSWKVKVKDFIDSQMRKIMEKQEAWMDKMMKTLEDKEKERMLREEEWRKEETERIEREHKFWAKERAWIEARDATLMEALQHFAGADELMASFGCQESTHNNHNLNEMGSDESMESAKIGCLGYDRSTNSLMCKGKLDSMKEFLRKTNGDNIEYTKKRKDSNSGSCYYHSQNGESIYTGGFCEFREQGQEMPRRIQLNYHGSSPSSSNAGNAIQDSCFRFLMGDGDNLWENYGSKINKGSEN